MESILACSDASVDADAAVEEAAGVARTFRAKLVVLYVEPLLDAREIFDPSRRPQPAPYLAALPARYPDLKVAAMQVAGDPASTICEVAAQEGAAMIVVGSRKVGSGRRLRGLVARGVLRRARCPVLIVDTRRAS